MKRSCMHIAAVAMLAGLLLTSAAHAISTRTLIAPRGEVDYDGFGTAISDAGDVNGDGYADIIVGAPGNDAGGLGAGRAYVFFGGPAADTLADMTFTGLAAGDAVGSSVSGAGDVNGDGYDDVIVGAPNNDAGGANAGRAYVFFGGPAPDAVPDMTLTGLAAGDQFGISVSDAGDFNGDGYADVLVGARFTAAGGNAYVFHGGASPDNVADLTCTAEASNDRFGDSVSGAGDVNGDGYDDVIIGAWLNSAGGVQAGRAYVFYGSPIADTLADLTFTAEASGDRFGQAVSGAGDVNADGYADLLVGAPLNDAGGNSAGRAYVYFGGPAEDEVADLTLTGESDNHNFGAALSDAGDVNGDGYGDIIVGAKYVQLASLFSVGRAYVFFGGGFPDATPDLIKTGLFQGDEFGYAVSGAGDVAGDGLSDFIVGHHASRPGFTGPGGANVYDQFTHVLTAPNGGETWPVGSTQTISWLGRELAYISLSADGGATFVEIRAQAGGNASNDIQIRVPHLPTRFAMVKIRPAYSFLGQDQSDSLFTIDTSVSLLTFTVAARPGGGAELTWLSEPSVGPQGIAGYRLYRSAAGASAGDGGRQIGPELITSTSYSDASGAAGSTYRLVAVNGLGDELQLGIDTLPVQAPLHAWPLPYRSGSLNVSFAAASGFGGGVGRVDLGLYDAAGRRVRSLEAGLFAPGYHMTRWDGRDTSGRPVPSGIYFLKLSSEQKSRQMKIVVLP